MWVCKKPKPNRIGHAGERSPREAAKDFWESRKRIGLLLDSGTKAHFYGQDESEETEPDDVGSTREYKVLNTHLGKAGGLNFALQALLHTEGVAAPKSKGALEVEKKVKSAPVAVAKKEVVPATAAANKAGAGLTLSQQAELAHVRHMIAGLTLSLESYKVAERQILELGGL